jgi:hypothetical protein
MFPFRDRKEALHRRQSSTTQRQVVVLHQPLRKGGMNMAVTQDQAIEIVNRYLVEHPEMQAEVLAAAHDTTGTSWVFLNYY